MKIRAASLADKATYLDCARRLRPTVSDQELAGDWQRIVEKRGQHAALLCVDDETILGIIEVSRRPLVPGFGAGPVAYVDGLWVEPGEARDQAAARLLAAAESWAHTRGCKQMVADAGVDEQWEQELRRQLGFEEIARRVLYRKPIERGTVAVAVTEAPDEAPPAPAPSEPAKPSPRPATTAPRRGPGLVHLVLFSLGILAFAFTDIWNGNGFTGVVLPLVDILFVVYVIGFILSVKYRRRIDTSERALSPYDDHEQAAAARAERER